MVYDMVYYFIMVKKGVKFTQPIMNCNKCSTSIHIFFTVTNRKWHKVENPIRITTQAPNYTSYTFRLTLK